MIHLSQNCTYI